MFLVIILVVTAKSVTTMIHAWRHAICILWSRRQQQDVFCLHATVPMTSVIKGPQGHFVFSLVHL